MREFFARRLREAGLALRHPEGFVRSRPARSARADTGRFVLEALLCAAVWIGVETAATGWGHGITRSLAVTFGVESLAGAGFLFGVAFAVLGVVAGLSGALGLAVLLHLGVRWARRREPWRATWHVVSSCAVFYTPLAACSPLALVPYAGHRLLALGMLLCALAATRFLWIGLRGSLRLTIRETLVAFFVPVLAALFGSAVAVGAFFLSLEAISH